MRVSLNLIKKYIDLPKDITDKQIAYDMTLRTVEVEDVESTADKYHDIVVGKILELKNHPNADRLRICITDIGEDKPVQIVCGGTNLYEGEYVVVSKPGSEVVWHGEGEPVKVKETKMRGESSYGMICAASEVYLEDFFPSDNEYEIVDLKGVDCKPGDNIADIVEMNDTVLEIDNKSLSNRPDLWGHYGIARELSAIYNVPLKKLDTYKLDKDLPKYNVEIKEKNKCNRYIGVEIDGIYEKESPTWMKSLLSKTGQRPINAIVDITNYVMVTVGQPLHAFDKTHVNGEKIIVRNAKENEELLLLDDNSIKLTKEDLVISDEADAMALAGIRGGKKDSILPDTKGIVLEVANFSANTIRKTGKRFAEKTDSSIRYEKGIDTQRVDQGVNLALELIKEIFPDSKIVKYVDVYPNKTKNNKIEVTEEFLDTRLGKKIDRKSITQILTSLGYEVSYKDKIYDVVVPTWRSTGDISLKDDVMGDIARILSFNSFEAKPIDITIEHSINQREVSLTRRISEYLANRCGFYEIYTYPWIDEKYINAARIDTSKSLKLTTPPAPELAYLRSSLIPGMLEAISKNLRYYNNFKLFEIKQVYEKGDYRPSSEDEILPIQTNYLTGSIVGKNAKEIFYELKGIIEEMSRYNHMEDIELIQKEKPAWADKNAYLNIVKNNEIIGSLGLLSVQTMNKSKIKRTNVAIFEINMEKLTPYKSRTNTYERLPELPLVEKDLSIIVDKDIKWEDIINPIKNKVKEIEFVDEYKGNQIPEGKKSITLKLKMINEGSTMTSDEINNKMKSILKVLNKKCNATLREE
ncbi:MAG: phenylalanine--tRNA ligase subunit beta [Bacilli bacterium]|nr:phenylalanine--tRNA ligase subunit beta [Bacilli bacterium]